MPIPPVNTVPHGGQTDNLLERDHGRWGSELSMEPSVDYYVRYNELGCIPFTLSWQCQQWWSRAGYSNWSGGPWSLKLPADQHHSPYHWSARPLIFSSPYHRDGPISQPIPHRERQLHLCGLLITVAHTLLSKGQWLSKETKLNTAHIPWQWRKMCSIKQTVPICLSST